MKLPNQLIIYSISFKHIKTSIKPINYKHVDASYLKQTEHLQKDKLTFQPNITILYKNWCVLKCYFHHIHRISVLFQGSVSLCAQPMRDVVKWKSLIRLVQSSGITWCFIHHCSDSGITDINDSLYSQRNLMFHLYSLRAKFCWRNINIYLHFMSFLHTDMTQVLKILPQVRPGSTYPT